MSRAFVREVDDPALTELPARITSEHPNWVTPHGLQLIEARVRELEQERERINAVADAAQNARVLRDLRYWQHRRASAQVVHATRTDKVRFGVRVHITLADDAEQTYTLVGEDEADPASGRISWLSPVAQALLGHQTGDEIELQGRIAEIRAITID